MKTLTLIDGQEVATIGQGTWHIGEQPGERARGRGAARRHRTGDDADRYRRDVRRGRRRGRGRRGYRGTPRKVFLVSKVYPHNASRKGLPAACERSLRRLGCETIDLYLLHWQGRYPLEETIEAFERLRDQGKILRWGVSNFDLGDMYELDGSACAANQVMYNLEERGIEYDLLPWCQERGMPVMAYCPVGQGGRLLRHPALGEIARATTPAAPRSPWPGYWSRGDRDPEGGDVRSHPPECGGGRPGTERRRPAGARPGVPAAYPQAKPGDRLSGVQEKRPALVSLAAGI